MEISRNTVLKSFFWKFLERGGSQIVNFIVTIILARLLLPEEYGIIALILVFVNIANVFVDGGLNTALIQNKESGKEDFNTIFFFSFFLSLVLYLILFLLAPLVSKFYGQDELTPIIRVLSLSVIIYSYNSVQSAFVSKNMLFSMLFRSTMISSVIAGLLGIFAAYKGLGVWALVIFNLTQAFVTMFVLRWSIEWKPSFQFIKERFVKLFDFGWKVFLSNLVISLFVNIRTLIIGKFYSASTLAFFDRGRQFPSLFMDNINSTIQAVLFPVFSDVQDNKENVRAMMRRSIKSSCLIIFPILVGLFAIAEPLVICLLTEKWLDAVPYIRIFCLGYMLMPIQTANMQAILSLGYSNITLKLELIKKFLEITILVISVLISAYAVAWGVVVYNFICLFINLFPNNKLLGYSIVSQIKDILPYLFSSLVMGCVVYCMNYISLPSIIILLIQLISGVLIYWGLMKIFKVEGYQYVENLVLDKIKSK